LAICYVFIFLLLPQCVPKSVDLKRPLSYLIHFYFLPLCVHHFWYKLLFMNIFNIAYAHRYNFHALLRLMRRSTRMRLIVSSAISMESRILLHHFYPRTFRSSSKHVYRSGVCCAEELMYQFEPLWSRVFSVRCDIWILINSFELIFSVNIHNTLRLRLICTIKHQYRKTFGL
jgi:hypothetical protein